MVNEIKYNPQILIVEDDPSIKSLIRMVVEKEDHWVATTVESGEHAVEAWNNCDFDVILMDLRLPEMDGIEATKQIREHERRSGRKHTPIIAFTALVTAADRQACAEAGFDDFISKPAKMQDVIDTVYKYAPLTDL